MNKLHTLALGEVLFLGDWGVWGIAGKTGNWGNWGKKGTCKFEFWSLMIYYKIFEAKKKIKLKRKIWVYY